MAVEKDMECLIDSLFEKGADAHATDANVGTRVMDEGWVFIAMWMG